jgi:hypothetical protein
MIDELSLKGTVSGRVIRANGEELPFAIDNMIVTTGKQYAVARLYSTSVTPLSHMGIGNSSDAPHIGQSTLIGEFGTRSAVTATITQNNIKFSSDFTNINSTVSEIGLFNSLAGGIMFARALIGPFPLTPTDTLALDWNVNVP